MKLRLRMFVVVAIACCGIASATQTASVVAGVSITADNLERLPNEFLRATGNVEVRGENFHVRADSVEFGTGRGTGGSSAEFGASGNVVLTLGRDRLVLAHLHFNPNAGTGVFQLPRGNSTSTLVAPKQPTQ